MKALPHIRNTSYETPVAIGDIVEDVSCAGCAPRPVKVVALFGWGLRIAPLHRLEGEGDYDCTRWRRLEDKT